MLVNQERSNRFCHFALECKGASELYEYLSLKIAEDEELLELSAFAQKGQPIPNMLFGAVHYLLLQGKTHALRKYYPSIVEHPNGFETVFLAFKDFCQRYKAEIIGLLQTKLVQTNEVRRCAYLYPAFCYMFKKVAKPLAQIEIGTSAGLQLFWDKYRYSYGTKKTYGAKKTTVHLTSKVTTESLPPLLNSPPPDRKSTRLNSSHVAISYAVFCF